MRTKNEVWDILNVMLNDTGLVKQQLDSFDDFITHGMQEIVKEVGKIEPDIEGFMIKLDRIEIEEPKIREADGATRPIYPMEARIRNLTYGAPVYLYMTPIYEQNGIQTQEEQVRVYVGMMPIMLRSKKCITSNMPPSKLIKIGEDPKDPGGYFIISGSERVLVTQEDLAPNKILVENVGGVSNITSRAKVLSTAGGVRTPLTIERKKDGTISVNAPGLPQKIPLIIHLRALGLETDKEITEAIGLNPDIQKELLPSIEESMEVSDGEEALDYIGRRVAIGQTQEYRIKRAENVLNRYLLPHLGTTSENKLKKARFIGIMARSIIELYLGIREEDDKDHYSNKRLRLAGDLLKILFRVAFNSLCRDIKYQTERASIRGKTPNLKTAVRADVITDRISHALATGNWVGGKTGVSQLLDRTNYISMLSHLRRVVSPLSRNQPHFQARDLHPTQWGKICVVPDTHVLLGDGVSQTCIADMEENFKSFLVTTVNENNLEEIQSDIVEYQKISSYEFGKHVLEIKTIAGRVIRATEDHPFLTKRGWVEAGDLRLSDKVLIRPTLDPSAVIDQEERVTFTVLDSENFLNGVWRNALPEDEQHFVEKDFEELSRLGLLPLDTDHPQLPVLARLLGAIITDGSVTNTVEFYLGTEEDAVAVHRDLESLGFIANPITKKEGVFQPDENQEPVNYQAFLITKGGAFKRLMMALGTPIGRRSEQTSTFPDWILNCPKEVKREFLGAFLGGDGSAPWAYKRANRKDSYKIRLPEVEIHKQPDYVDSQIKFFESLKQLLAEFGVKVNSIKTKHISRTNRIAVDLVFDASKDNILRLCSNVGYRYCKEKQNKAQLISEFLAYRREEINRRIQHRQKAIELYDQGLTQRQIAEQLGISYRIVTSILERRFQNRNAVHPKSSWSVGRFFEETQADLETGMLYVPLAYIRVIDEDVVCDFTTALDTHSFIANGFVTHNCPNETPEGPNCGLVKNLALMAQISRGTDEKRVLQILVDRGMEPLERLEYPEGKTCVYLNGTLVGTYEKPEQLINEIRKSRRREEISQEINIAYHPKEKEVIVNCDSGRVRRPLVIIEDGKNLLEEKHIEMIRKGKLQWKDLIASAIIEYLDAEEEENAYIAIMPNEITKEHTHVEISPAFILGVSASLIPFAEHNQSPRNTYEAGMAKQALGLYAPNYRIRVDTRAHLLHYSQTPIVRTQTIDLIGYDKRAAGQNFIVAVLSYEGYNIEDALVINKASIERGLARSTFFRTYDAEERKYPGGQEDRFEIPTKDIRGYRIPEAYRYLNEDGIIEPETEVIGGIVIIGRTSPPRFIEEYARFEIPTPNRRETSITMRHGEKGVVDTVILTETNEGNRLLKVKIRDDRKPTLGDKFASRHGQKGVIGQIASQEDMPFTEDGIVPDLIINPHAMPSRMTVGQLIESATGIAAAMEGKAADGTPFIGMTIKEIEKTLKKHGYHPAGETTLYDGITGEKYPARIYMGIVYMQRLHHLVADKIHARPRGPIQILTRQPTEGRAREGGLRFGEMERDCLIGHGAALLLKERLLEGSDKVEALICEKCGLLAVYDRSRDRYYCPVCDIGAKIANIEMSYAFKLLLQELMSLGIAPRLRLKEKA